MRVFGWLCSLAMVCGCQARAEPIAVDDDTTSESNEESDTNAEETTTSSTTATSTAGDESTSNWTSWTSSTSSTTGSWSEGSHGETCGGPCSARERPSSISISVTAGGTEHQSPVLVRVQAFGGCWCEGCNGCWDDTVEGLQIKVEGHEVIVCSIEDCPSDGIFGLELTPGVHRVEAIGEFLYGPLSDVIEITVIPGGDTTDTSASSNDDTSDTTDTSASSGDGTSDATDTSSSSGDE